MIFRRKIGTLVYHFRKECKGWIGNDHEDVRLYQGEMPEKVCPDCVRLEKAKPIKRRSK